jgi:hypothetical protein
MRCVSYSVKVKLGEDGLPDCEDYPHPDPSQCICDFQVECYEGWYDEYWYHSHDEDGNPI